MDVGSGQWWSLWGIVSAYAGMLCSFGYASRGGCGVLVLFQEFRSFIVLHGALTLLTWG